MSISPSLRSTKLNTVRRRDTSKTIKKLYTFLVDQGITGTNLYVSKEAFENKQGISGDKLKEYFLAYSDAQNIISKFSRFI